MSWSNDSCTGKSFSEYYDYGAGNLVTYKKLHATVLAVDNGSPDITASFTYTQEGLLRVLSYGSWVFTYSFDTMGRPTGLTDVFRTQWVSNVSYGGPAGEMTALKYATGGTWSGHQWYNEARTFNVRGQLTRMTATGSADTGYTTPQTVDLQYNFSGTANDGKTRDSTLKSSILRAAPVISQVDERLQHGHAVLGAGHADPRRGQPPGDELDLLSRP